ncbi:MAG: hypothetical protein RBS43_08455 [Candidatus Cloacimonas sp.]|jgi:hypothetical protein|nr:hypothetical protein [Candidatus Cloacimonas sp.]
MLKWGVFIGKILDTMEFFLPQRKAEKSREKRRKEEKRREKTMKNAFSPLIMEIYPYICRGFMRSPKVAEYSFSCKAKREERDRQNVYVAERICGKRICRAEPSIQVPGS